MVWMSDCCSKSISFTRHGLTTLFWQITADCREWFRSQNDVARALILSSKSYSQGLRQNKSDDFKQGTKKCGFRDSNRNRVGIVTVQGHPFGCCFELCGTIRCHPRALSDRLIGQLAYGYENYVLIVLGPGSRVGTRWRVRGPIVETLHTFSSTSDPATVQR